MKKQKKREREWKAWAGIVYDTIHTTVEANSMYRIKAIYPSKRVAKLAYEKVIQVVIREVRKGGK